MKTKERIIKELVYSASGRFSACETQQDFIDQQRLYEALLTERIDDLLLAAIGEERTRMSEAALAVARECDIDAAPFWSKVAALWGGR